MYAIDFALFAEFNFYALYIRPNSTIPYSHRFDFI